MAKLICLIFLFPSFLFALNKDINPHGTYLFVDYSKDTKTVQSTALLIRDLKAKPHDTIELSFSSSADIDKILGVFADASGNFIPPKEDFISPVSAYTKYNKLPTDISFDFGISSAKCTNIKVPEKATQILFSMNDSFFSNNENISLSVKANKLLFEITESEVFQVIEDPKFNLKNRGESFDLTRNKAAVLLITYQKRVETSSDEIFKPAIQVNGTKFEPMCLNTEQRVEQNCYFTLNDFDTRGILEQTIILPMGTGQTLNKAGKFNFVFNPVSKKHCRNDLLSYTFHLNIHETRKLQIGFTLIDQSFISDTDWEYFIQKSLLDFNLLKKIFPVPEIGSNIPQWIVLEDKLNIDKTIEDKPESNQDVVAQGKIITLKESDANRPTRVLRDLVELKKMRIRQQLSKLFAVASNEYFSSIDKDNVAGFVIFTESGQATENVGFIRLDQGGTGTILHELGHLLGQLNEFYKKSNQNLAANDICNFGGKTDYCFKFKNFRGLHASLKEDYSNWRFIQRRDSIMNNSPNLEEQWTDRDTYSKALHTLSSLDKDPEIIIFSGIYNKKIFLEPDMEYLAEGFLTPSDPEGDLKVKFLDASGKELYSLQISTKVSIEFIDSFNKQSVTEDLTPAPIAVALPYFKQAKKLIVVTSDEEEKEIYSEEITDETILPTSDKVDLSKRRVFE